MQIGSSNPLSFLPGNNAPLAGKANDKDTDATGGAASRSVAVPDATPAQDAASAILSIQADAAPGAALPTDLVYSKGAQTPSSSADSAGNADVAGGQYSQAMQRSAVSPSSLSIDKDGVLVARPASAVEIKSQAFVSSAVTTMRNYADEQDRLKQISAASLVPRSMAEVQKLASRFKLFA